MSAGSPLLSGEGRRQLLALARGTLEAHFRGEPPPRLPSDRSEAFGDPRAVFVTLRIGDRLRGCIGTLAPEGDLSRTVPKFALRAAFEDPRFSGLASEELALCTIEISVLTAPRPLDDPEEIVIGRDGLILEIGGRRALQFRSSRARRAHGASLPARAGGGSGEGAGVSRSGSATCQ